MSNLRTFDFSCVPGDKISITQLLHLFEHAPLLRKIRLYEALPDFSDVPLGRMVPLPNLNSLVTRAHQAHTIVTNHLSIPTGATIIQGFDFGDADPQIHIHLPSTFENFKNLSSITSIDLHFIRSVQVRLTGPYRGLVMRCFWAPGNSIPADTHLRVLQSLNLFRISEVEKLTIGRWSHFSSRRGTIEASSHQTFSLVDNLRVLALKNCVNLPFVIALNPQKNASRVLICPKLEGLHMDIEREGWLCIRELLEMAGERALGGAKLKAVTIVCSQGLVPARELFKLRAHVLHFEYRYGRYDVSSTVPDNANCG